MTNKELTKRLIKFRGMYRQIAEETSIPYSTIRKVACGALPNAGIKITQPIAAWMKGRVSP